VSWRLAEPWWLLALALPVLVLVLRPRRGGPGFGAYGIAALALTRSRGPLVLRLLAAAALSLLVLALARPQSGTTTVERDHSGRDLMLCIDLSLSMQVDDLGGTGPSDDRLAAVFAAAKRFVARRPNDRFGLAFFGSEALASCPLTADHATVIEFLERTEAMQRESWADASRGEGEQGMLGDGTNLGLGLGVALKWVDAQASAGRAIVLITDGRDSAQLPNWVDPVAAARHAAAKRVRVHCVGVGNPRGTMTWRQAFGRTQRTPVPQRLLPDPARLDEIAAAGGGVALMAVDDAALDRVIDRLDELEPTTRQVRQRDDYADRFVSLLIAAAATAALALAVEPRLRGPA
jgi:Ca-activated chloride channel family protein